MLRGCAYADVDEACRSPLERAEPEVPDVSDAPGMGRSGNVFAADARVRLLPPHVERVQRRCPAQGPRQILSAEDQEAVRTPRALNAGDAVYFVDAPSTGGNTIASTGSAVNMHRALCPHSGTTNSVWRAPTFSATYR